MYIYIFIICTRMHMYNMYIDTYVSYVHTRACDKYVYIRTPAYTYMCVFPHTCICHDTDYMYIDTYVSYLRVYNASVVTQKCVRIHPVS